MEMKRVVIVLGVLLAASASALASVVGNTEDFVAGKVAPFTVKLKDLDASYIRFTTPYVSGGGWLWAMQRYAGDGVPAYTQGQTVNIGSESYLIAYMVDAKGGDSSMITFGRPDPNAPEPEPVTADSILSLTLLGQRGVVVMTKVRPFDLAAELADFQRLLDRYQEMAATRSAMNQPIAAQAPDNLKMMAAALKMYAADYDGVLPPMNKPEAFRKALDDYVENAEVFRDPETDEFYGLNPALSGKKITEIKDPGKTIAIYQVKPGKDGNRGVVFADGSTKRLTAAEWTELKTSSKIP
jgi:hypothetical protein